MLLLSFSELEDRLTQRYAHDAAKFPEHFARLIPRPAPAQQIDQVRSVLLELTGNDVGSLRELLITWDLSDLVLGGFRFGAGKAFATRLLETNESESTYAWWEDGEDFLRPGSLVFLAQGDPYTLLFDAESDSIYSFVTGDGIRTRTRISRDASACLRLLGTIQINARLLLASPQELSSMLDRDCDLTFWTEQMQHWAQFD